jgi:hypothetical protein
MVEAMLSRASRAGTGEPATFMAEFRHAQEQSNFEALTHTLDQASDGPYQFRPDPQPFFSGNLASLGRALNSVNSVAFAMRDRGDAVEQTVTYRMK